MVQSGLRPYSFTRLPFARSVRVPDPLTATASRLRCHTILIVITLLALGRALPAVTVPVCLPAATKLRDVPRTRFYSVSTSDRACFESRS